ncbi:pentatricopeptide repeat-containing protein At3g22470, mitochondrial-like [Trifolium pratense]|uniref:pentatricopeptide repeat-containing protein At3g22470, mitochondrial-like n=1 Tax=Trifolium pratense TaxID=57577 RepID=UPI001E692502|nr:pentatricopeptide repeat-containing protein At3g22470, mitochondrial-like [Trifolium pratense]
MCFIWAEFDDDDDGEDDGDDFTGAFDGYCLKGEIHKALHFHDKVVAQGFQLNQVSYGTLINGLCKVGETRSALQLLRRIDGKLLQPNVVMYSAIIERFCDKGLFDEALALLSKMKDNSCIPNAATYEIIICSLIDGLGKFGRISHALKLVVEMHDRGGLQPNIFTYNSILDALCKNHHVEKAIALLKKVKDEGIQPEMNTYTILIHGLWFCDKGLFDEVLALLSKMKDNSCIPNAATYEIIIRSLFNKGENDKAHKLLH